MVPTEQDVEMIIDFFHDMFATVSVQASKLWPASPSSAASVWTRNQRTFAARQFVTPDARRDGHGGRGRDRRLAARAPLPAVAAR